MLSQLYLRNFAVIKEATIDFKDGFNVFTGETGAGKTILISAVSGVLGTRLSKDIIRTGEDSAYISALFTDLSEEAVHSAEQLGYSLGEENSLLITRQINTEAKNVCRINGQPATLQVLKEVSSHLIDIHGQRDSGQLLNPASHLHLLDGFGQLEHLKKAYKIYYDRAVSLKKEINRLSAEDVNRQQRIDQLSYAVEEINNADLAEEEEQTLMQQKTRILHAQQIAQLLENAHYSLNGDEDMSAGAVSLVENLQEFLNQLVEFLPEMKELSDRAEGIAIELDEMRMDIGGKLEEMEYDPNSLEAIEERLDFIHRLKRKYGGEIKDILAYGRQAEKELQEIETSDQRLQELSAELEDMMEDFEDAADELTKARLDAAEKFISCVEEELCFLNMPSVKLSVHYQETALKASGQDEIEFLISTNIGEPAKPMAKIASGGELSRIMLSIKNVFAHQDQIGTSVFDEIDTGVSGKAAQKIGMKMKQVSAHRQVIAVTHLAQVAVFANHHLCIQKHVEEDRTFTEITPLEGADREREIARIISGENITDVSLENAREMISLAHS